ncbi:MAG UNVERIFIED_CONTAM: hypothetical protein LVT10_18625 [Anaerolineae bacterium]
MVDAIEPTLAGVPGGRLAHVDDALARYSPGIRSLILTKLNACAGKT